MKKPEVLVFHDLEALSLSAAERLGAAAREAVSERGRFSIALSGGHTPRRLYELLAEGGAAKLPWERIHLFWGDERFVPPDDPASNFAMVKEALLKRIAIPPGNLHPVPTGLGSPFEAAAAYEEELRAFFADEGEPAFDLALLGLGGEGHTASLFPGSPALAEQDAWVAAAEAPPGVVPRRRITLTLRGLSAARAIWFLVAGAEKAPVVRILIDGSESEATQLPAGRVRTSGSVTWFLDRAARGL